MQESLFEETRRFLAVIGTAGRKDDARRLSTDLYEAAYSDLVAMLNDGFPGDLVSGGAAVADHLAVRAYLDGHATALRLYLPAAFESSAFKEGGGRFDPGRTANYYHREFSKWYGRSSQDELANAITRGAEVFVVPGFKQRNSALAKVATDVVAYTFGADVPPAAFSSADPAFLDAERAGLKDGGTAHTWGQTRNCISKRHVSLSWMEQQLSPRSAPAPGRMFS